MTDRPRPTHTWIADAEPGYRDGFQDGYLAGWAEAFDWIEARQEDPR